MDWDGANVTYVNTNPDAPPMLPPRDSDVEKEAAKRSFREFIRNFRLGEADFIYRTQLRQRYQMGQQWLEVDLAHLDDYDSHLMKLLQDKPDEYLPIFEEGAKDALDQILLERGGEDEQDKEAMPDLQITLRSDQVARPLRHLTASSISRLVKVEGIVITAAAVRARATAVRVQCTQCHKVKIVNAGSGFGGVVLPTACDGQNPNPPEGADPNDPGAMMCKSRNYVILSDQSMYIDQQPLKLQESPEMVPTGEMPRSMSLSCERHLVDKVAPGTRVSVIGIFSTFGSTIKKMGATAVKASYLKVVGIQVETEGAGRASMNFTPQEEEKFVTLARSPDIYQRLWSSIAPSISGDYTVDIKKALVCQLLAGSRKTLPDGMRLRGDINILLLGDPSTAKSQMLKFIEKVAPVGVYTSGKGSSAAGLTASVIRDAKGEFSLEGGAMVLGDGGIVCIDEFDKMRDTDRVAIHEAMEQQTISIAKAGITTILNSRTSVLAAANPIYGRYDDLKSTAENIDLMTTILSRFDLIFIVRDIRDEERDRSIARHVMNVHMNANLSQGIRATQVTEGEIDMVTLKKFVSYCRARCAPRLSAEAGQTLASEYVRIRDSVRRRSLESNESQQTVPITVRQLEALVRISESLAKMRLQQEVTAEDVREAMRLFQASTGQAVAADFANANDGGDGTGRSLSFESPEQVAKAEEFLKRRIPVGSTFKTSRIQEEATGQMYSHQAILRAINIMVRRGELQEKNQGRMLKRLK